MRIFGLIIFGLIAGLANEPAKVFAHSARDRLGALDSLELPNYIDSALVYVSFVVDTSGEIGKVKAFKIICKGCDRKTKKKYKEAAEDVVKRTPKKNRRKEPVMFTLPVKFKL
jgi:hypothetical protein